MSDPAAEDLQAENQRLRLRILALENELAAARAHLSAATDPAIVADQQLAGNIQRLHSLIDSQTTYVIRVDLEGCYTYANRAFCQTFGLESAALLGKRAMEMVIPEDREQLTAATNACLTNPGTPVKATLRKALPSGDLRWAQWELFAIVDGKGIPNEIQCVGFDITDRIHAEDALRRSKAEIDELYALAREEVAARKRAEEAQRVQAQELQLALDAARMGAWRWDLVTSEAIYSENLARLYSLVLADPPVDHLDLLDRVYPEDRPRIAQAIQDAIEGTEEFEIEFRILDGNGEERWTVARGRVFVDAQNQPVYLAGIARDINPRKQAEARMERSEARMERSEARLSAIFDAGLDIVALVRPDGTFEYINSMVEKVLGYTPDEFVRAGATDIIHPDDRSIVVEQIVSLLSRPGDSIRLEFKVPHKDGSWRWMENKISNFVDYAPVGALVSIGHDVTERKAAEAALRELNETLEQRVHERTQALEREIAERVLVEESLRSSEARWRSLVENAPAVIAMLDAEGTLLFINHTPGGPIPDELIGRCIYDWLAPATAGEVRQALQTVLATGQTMHYETELLLRDGNRVWFENYVSAVWRDGRVEAVIYLSSDISQRKRTEAELRVQQDFARQIMETMGQGLVVYDSAGVIEYANLCVAEMFGYRQETLIGRPMATLVHTDDVPIVADNLARRAANQSDAYEVRMQTVDGTNKYVLVAATPRLRDGKPGGGIAVITDLTERRNAEEALRLREEQFRFLADNTTDMISQHTLDEKLLYVTPSVYSILGYEPDELLRGDVAFEVHPDDIAALSASAYELLLEGETSRVELRMRRKDGTYVWIEAISRLVRDPVSGEPVTIVRSARDVTARRLAEEALRLRSSELTIVNVELAKASRLKDEFLANMSHELRTPLTGVLGLTEGLQNLVYGPLNERQLRALRLIDESGRHLLSLINDILDLSKVEAGKMELVVTAVRAADICEASLNMVRQLAQNRRQQLSYALAHPNAQVRADPRRLKQILVNLLSNAVKFTPEDGELGLKVEVKPGDDMLSFVVWDKGIGISPEQQGHLFQPFMQLDGGLTRQYTGTGLGLALVRRLTELQGGTIYIESVPGEGSRFTIRLPLIE
jgi:PAS domain S-box-containing protein